VLDLNPETVQFIITRAHEYQVSETASLEAEDVNVAEAMNEEFVHDVDDPTFLELKATIEDLEPDQQVSLVALMWLGRGDFTIDEWAAALQRAGDSWNERSAEYLIRTPLLADYLGEGLEQFGEESDDDDA